LGTLTTHVLDLSTGKPAQGLQIELFALDGGDVSLTRATTNSDGRVDSPLLTPETIKVGEYKLLFQAGEYLRRVHGISDADLFLDQVPLVFRIFDATQKYHVPLLLSPYGYSTYRGS
jgi:5-hydroxyisourate hydrolase